MAVSDLISLFFSVYGAFIATFAYLKPRTAPALPPPPVSPMLVVMVVVSAPSSSASCTDSKADTWIAWYVLARSEMDAMLGTVTDLQIGSTLGIAQPVVSKLRRDRGILSTRDALTWTAELQALLPRLSDEALAARAGCGLVQIKAIRRGEQVLTNKTSCRETADLLGVWSDEDLAAQHGGTPARYASARQRRGISVRRRAPEARAYSVR